ncbi:Retrovirus-related Pol polyprotein from transposon RE1 [Vitis vinifera]|uniref:Retrovirus-related Pol polyprotein from transposon RE1 n=1 Tax=Vitis vinifera TaxID=29760 RepID=A0A438JZV5_VITVI|nr:Retrovirus-related Pol polyprotein from transposon RE1 [Vitis vinifera]
MIRKEESMEGALQAKAENTAGDKDKKNNNKNNNNKTDINNKNKDGTYPPCPHCKKTNHPQRKCWWRLDVKCRKCGQIGHMERICKSQQHEEAKASTEQHQEEQLFVATCSTTIKGKGTVAIKSLTGFKVIFEDKWCMIKDAKGRDVFKVKMRAKSFALNLMKDEQIAFSSTVSNAELWHRRCVIAEDKLADCVACQYGKQTRTPFPQIAWRAMYKLQLVHTDVGGPQKTPSLNGSKMHKIRSDNGKEYTNEIFYKFCEEAGIEHQLTAPYTPQQNGVKRDKLDKKAEPGVFIGYSNSSKAYRIFQPQNGKILVSRDVKFMEDRQWNWEESINMQLPEVPQYFDEDIDDVPVRVARLDTIRMLFALTAQKEWKTYQLDVKSAFLNGYLQEEIYVEQPKGFQVKGQEEKVYLLKKALYGLKQAPRAWYSRIDEHLQSLGFVKSPSEATLYVKGIDANLIEVSVYVDDLLVTGSNEKLVKEFKVEMLKVFEMTNLGLMSYFLGMEVKQNHDGVFISQKKYAKEILNKFHMEDCKRTNTPMNQKEKFSKDDGAEKVDESQYRSLIGCLMYLTATRPDIMFSVSLLSRFMHCASEVHFQAAKRIDFVSALDPEFFSWSSKKQDVIAQSTAEIEYVAANATVNQAIWIRKILADLHMKQKEPTHIHVDNQAAITISNGSVFHDKTKHFKIKLYHLREEQKDGEVKLLYCKTEDQIADVLTKALPKARFETLRSKIGLCNY